MNILCETDTVWNLAGKLCSRGFSENRNLENHKSSDSHFNLFRFISAAFVSFQLISTHFTWFQLVSDNFKSKFDRRLCVRGLRLSRVEMRVLPQKFGSIANCEINFHFEAASLRSYLHHDVSAVY